MSAERPVVAVSAVVVDDERLLMVRRGPGPAGGRWSLPGGHVEGGESLVEAVVRELAEETALAAVCSSLVGWTEVIEDDLHAVILTFDCVLMDDGEPVAGSDAAEARWVDLAEVSELRLTDGLAEFLHEHGIIDTIT